MSVCSNKSIKTPLIPTRGPKWHIHLLADLALVDVPKKREKQKMSNGKKKNDSKRLVRLRQKKRRLELVSRKPLNTT